MTVGGDVGRGWDFFIFYTQADRPWAEWIARMLEEDGHRVLIQAWDFVPGSNWIRGMEAGTRDAARTIAVVSDAYLKSVYGSSEWQAAVAGDPTGSGRRLLVVRVALCEPAGLLAGVVRVDLFAVTEAAAKARLRDMVAAAAVGRAKPPGTLLPDLPVRNDPALILERINDVVIATGGPKRKIGKPLAIALTKMDALDHNLKDNSPLRNQRT